MYRLQILKLEQNGTLYTILINFQNLFKIMYCSRFLEIFWILFCNQQKISYFSNNNSYTSYPVSESLQQSKTLLWLNGRFSCFFNNFFPSYFFSSRLIRLSFDLRGKGSSSSSHNNNNTKNNNNKMSRKEKSSENGQGGEKQDSWRLMANQFSFHGIKKVLFCFCGLKGTHKKMRRWGRWRKKLTFLLASKFASYYYVIWEWMNNTSWMRLVV